MKFIETPLKDAYLIEPVVYRDKRGFFMEPYNRRVFEANGIDIDFVQDNHSLSVERGVLRGLHFQRAPHAQTKLIRAVCGAIYDAIVDLRPDSPTYRQWYGVELNDQNMRMLLVPKGFAHGFCTLSENCHIQYKVDDFYAPDADGGIRWNDPELKIEWPVENPILSDKDAALPFLSEVGEVY